MPFIEFIKADSGFIRAYDSSRIVDLVFVYFYCVLLENIHNQSVKVLQLA